MPRGWAKTWGPIPGTAGNEGTDLWPSGGTSLSRQPRDTRQGQNRNNPFPSWGNQLLQQRHIETEKKMEYLLPSDLVANSNLGVKFAIVDALRCIGTSKEYLKLSLLTVQVHGSWLVFCRALIGSRINVTCWRPGNQRNASWIQKKEYFDRQGHSGALR